MAEAQSNQVKRGWLRVLLLTIFSFGLYTIYWFYVTRRDVFAEMGSDKSAGLHTLGLLVPILNLFLVYWLTKDIADLTAKIKGKPVEVPLIFLLWFFGGVVGQVFVQISWNEYWDKKLGNKAEDVPLKFVEFIPVIIGGLFAVLFSFAFFGLLFWAILNTSRLDSAAEHLTRASNLLNMTGPGGLPSAETVERARAEVRISKRLVDQYEPDSMDRNYKQAMRAEIEAFDNYLTVYQDIYADNTITSDELTRFQIALTRLNKADSDRRTAEIQLRTTK